jgi:hypothetical protein
MDRWITTYFSDGVCAFSANVVTAAERFLPQLVMRVALRTTIGLCASIAAQPVLDAYIRTESAIAKAGLLANIGPGQSQCSGAKVGKLVFENQIQRGHFQTAWHRHRFSEHR